MPIRVAFDARIIGRRGIGRYTDALIKGLAVFPDRVLTVLMLGRGHRRGGGSEVALRMPGYVLQEQLEYALRLGHGRFDLVHLTANTAPLLRIGWPPTVVTVHDVMYLMSRTDLQLSPSPRQALGRLYRLIAFHTGTERVDHLIADSTHTANELARRVEGLPPITVVHPGVDDRFFENAPVDLATQVLARYSLDAGRYFLHPGAIDPRKNTSVVLAAFEKYRTRGGHLDLAVVGLSHAHQAMLRASHTSGVHLLPFVSNEDLLILLQHAYSLIYVPSEEGFGYPVVEAMAAGVPAIISSIDVLEEMSAGAAWTIKPGDSELLADTLARVTTQPDRLSEIVVNGRIRAQQFTTRRMAEETLRVYEEVLATSR